MKRLLTMLTCFLFGLSVIAGCSGGGSAYVPPPKPPVSPTPDVSASPSSALALVNPQPVPPAGNVGQNYWLDMSQYVQGGTGSISFALKTGTLPTGLTLSGAAVSGIPTTIAASHVVITATDSGSPKSSVDVPTVVTINAMLPLAISPSSGNLAGGTVGVAYNRHWCGHWWLCSGLRLSSNGGFIPTSFSWVASSAPPGLSLDTSGFISGTPTKAGTYHFVTTLTDSEAPPKSVSANYTITVSPAPSPSPSPSPSASP